MLCPRKVFITLFTWPVPWQAGQVLMSEAFFVPFPPHSLQGTFFSMVISFSAPRAISSRVIFTRTLMSRPLLTLCEGPSSPPKPLPNPLNPPNPPPKRLFRMSFRSPKPPLKSGPACPPIPACPNLSYMALLSASLSTE